MEPIKITKDVLSLKFKDKVDECALKEAEEIEKEEVKVEEPIEVPKDEEKSYEDKVREAMEIISSIEPNTFYEALCLVDWCGYQADEVSDEQIQLAHNQLESIDDAIYDEWARKEIVDAI